ncbi:unnamed protein product, partial [Bubo scandiacus]
RPSLRDAEQGCCSFCLQEAPWQRTQLAGGGQPCQAMSWLLPTTPGQPCSFMSCISPPKQCFGVSAGLQPCPKCSCIEQQRELWETKRSRRSLSGAALGKEGGRQGVGRGNCRQLCSTSMKQIGHLLVYPLDEK